MTTNITTTTPKNETTTIELFNAALTYEKSDTVILCDVSGSMTSIIRSVDRSKFDVMKDALLASVSTLDNAAVFMFASQVHRVRSFEEVTAMRYQLGGGTDLGAALKKAARLNPAHIIVITDGQPNDAGKALHEAQDQLCRIDVFYCGSGATNEVLFCSELAQYGGQAVIDPTVVTMLETVTLFLGDGVMVTEAPAAVGHIASSPTDEEVAAVLSPSDLANEMDAMRGEAHHS